MKAFKKAGLLSLLLVFSLALSLLAGCGKKDVQDTDESGSESSSQEESETEEAVVYDPDEVAVTAGGLTANSAELFFYYALTKSQWENNYGITDWDVELSGYGISYGEYLKQQVENTVLQDMYLVDLAEARGVQLTDEEKAAADEDAQNYLAAMDAEDMERYGLNIDNVSEVLSRATLAQKTYNDLIQEELDNLTEEELKTCEFKHVQHILVSTDREVETSEDGQVIVPSAEDTEAYKEEKRQEAQSLLDRAKAGEDFEALANEYTDDSGVDYYINSEGNGPDGMKFYDAFAEAANKLAPGEISDLVEMTYGFHIIKCIADKDEASYETARENLAADKVDASYGEWDAEVDEEFFEKWTNLKVSG